ncbi:MAG: ATP-dependent sacrificial sulfur transferase LarE [bacterium]|nr:ATP-dependent sacrificial sulfur transferase LarE [bacterium]
MDGELQAKYDRLRGIIGSLERVAVAFSAGVDSTLVLKVALDVLGPENVVAVTGNSDSLARAEFEAAKELADAVGAEHVILNTGEFENPDYLANPENRCYYCKTTLYDEMERFIRQRGITEIINGINADDFGDWRPGIQAAREHSVRCPAAEAEMTKADVRALSEHLGLPTFDKPASPCLSSRVQYGEQITPEKLRMIETCEAYLHELGLPECRVRHHENLARIEVPADRVADLADPDTRGRIIDHFRQAGYTYVTLDLQGFRSGSMNEVIAFGQAQAWP